MSVWKSKIKKIKKKAGFVEEWRSIPGKFWFGGIFEEGNEPSSQHI